MVCGVWCAVCGMRGMMCGVWCVVCSVCCAVCVVQCAVCGVWCVVCGVWYVVCREGCWPCAASGARQRQGRPPPQFGGLVMESSLRAAPNQDWGAG